MANKFVALAAAVSIVVLSATAGVTEDMWT